MFLQQTMSPWFAVQRASQLTMIVLAIATLFVPYLYQPEEADAGFWMIAIGIGGIAVAIWVATDKACNNGCGMDVDSPSSTHLVQCSNCGVNAWSCPGELHQHQTTCGKCNDIYWDCPSNSQASNHSSCS